MLIQIQSIENIIIKSIVAIIAVFNISVIIISMIRMVSPILLFNIHFVAVVTAYAIFSFPIIFEWFSKIIIIIIEWSILSIEVIGFYLIGFCNHFCLRIAASWNHLRLCIPIRIRIIHFVTIIIIIIKVRIIVNILFIVWIIMRIIAAAIDVVTFGNKSLIILVLFNRCSKYHALRLAQLKILIFGAITVESLLLLILLLLLLIIIIFIEIIGIVFWRKVNYLLIRIGKKFIIDLLYMIKLVVGFTENDIIW